MATPTIGTPLAGYYYDAATNQLRPLVQGGPPGPVGPAGPTGPAGPPGGAAGQADNVSLTGTNVTVPAVGWQKVPLNSQNVGFNWDNTNKRWVCPTTGAYNISGVCSFTMTAAQNSRVIVSIWVNGAERTRGTDYTAGTTNSTGAGGIAYCDTYLFAGDYVELYSYSNPVKALEWVAGTSNSNMLTVRLLTGVGPPGPTGAQGPQGIAGTPGPDVRMKARRTTAFSITSTFTDVVFNTELYDTNNAYNTTTGVFTAPQAGTYKITTQILGVASAVGVWFYTHCLLNGSTMANGSCPPASAVNQVQTAQIITTVVLAANDTIKIATQSMGTGFLDQGQANSDQSFLAIELITQGAQGPQGLPGDLSQSVADGLYVNVTGDTMTGDLQVSKLKTGSGNLIIAANLGVLDIQSQAKVLVGPGGVLNDGQDTQVVVPKSYLETTTLYRAVSNSTQRDAWNAPAGSMCFVTTTNTLYIRKGSSWYFWDSPWLAFTPTLICPGGTNPTLGTGSTQAGRYRFVAGNTVQFSLNIAFGTGGGFNAGNGQYVVAGFPIPMGVNFGNYMPAGTGHLTLTAGNGFRYNPAALKSPSANGFEIYTPAAWWSNSPQVPVAGNAIQIWGQYECDNYLA
jgi:hypothetical protein